MGREQTQEVSASASSSMTLQLLLPVCCACVSVVTVHWDCAPTGNSLVGYLAEKWPKVKIKKPSQIIFLWTQRLSFPHGSFLLGAPCCYFASCCLRWDHPERTPPSHLHPPLLSGTLGGPTNECFFFLLWDYFTRVSTCFSSCVFDFRPF